MKEVWVEVKAGKIKKNQENLEMKMDEEKKVTQSNGNGPEEENYNEIKEWT